MNHGSGRMMARGEAKRQLAAIHDEIDQEMRSIELVERTRTARASGHINSLGYAGAFLAKTEDEKRRLRSDPLEVLGRAGVR